MQNFETILVLDLPNENFEMDKWDEMFEYTPHKFKNQV